MVPALSLLVTLLGAIVLLITGVWHGVGPVRTRPLLVVFQQRSSGAQQELQGAAATAAAAAALDTQPPIKRPPAPARGAAALNSPAQPALAAAGSHDTAGSPTPKYDSGSTQDEKPPEEPPPPSMLLVQPPVPPLQQRPGPLQPPPPLPPPADPYDPLLAQLAVTDEDRAVCEGLHPALVPAVHILDPNDLQPDVPQLPGPEHRCNLSSPMVWPHMQPGRGADAADTTEHWAYQHAAGYWVAQAMRNSTAVRLVTDKEQADIVYVDMHCYHSWMYSFSLPSGNHSQWPPSDYVKAIAAHAESLPHFARRHGADWVFGTQTHPGVFNYWARQYRLSLHIAGERWQLAPTDRAAAVTSGTVAVVPYAGVENLDMEAAVVGSARPVLLFWAGACSFQHDSFGEEWWLHFSSGKLLRQHLVEGLAALGAGDVVRVMCNAGTATHRESMEGMRHAVFCPVIAGDTQSSRRLTETILNGCIPVFFGRPYHNLPLAEDIDYRSFSVFIKLKDDSGWMFPPAAEERPGAAMNRREYVLEQWPDDVDVSGVEVEAGSVAEAYAYLQGLPRQRVRRMQAALEAERWKLHYGPPPGEHISRLGGIVVRRLCHRAAVLRRLAREGRLPGPGRQRQRRKQRQRQAPKK